MARLSGKGPWRHIQRPGRPKTWCGLLFIRSRNDARLPECPQCARASKRGK